jgi:hypothetical protein
MSVRKTRKTTSGDYVIAIPSYKRAETLRDKTLTVLEHYGIPARKIHVFVANKDEKAVYQEILKKGTYGELIVGVPGMGAIRNFITTYYPIGKRIVNVDDDISAFIQFSENARRHEAPLDNLDSFIRKAFADSKKSGFRLWGVYPVANGFFMKAGPPSSDLKYIIGCFWGITNPGLSTLKVTIDDKEDYLRSIIMYLADGGVLRYRDLAPKTAYYKEPGGMQEERTKNRVTKSAEVLHKAFPILTSLNATKKSGYLELRLKDKREEGERIFGAQALKDLKLPKL